MSCEARPPQSPQIEAIKLMPPVPKPLIAACNQDLSPFPLPLDRVLTDALIGT